MDGKKQNIEREVCSLDVVQLDSSDDDDFKLNGLRDNDMESLTSEINRLSSSASFKDEDKDEIDSDEEKDILRGIRDEIDCKVREEMKEELVVYESRLRAIENGELPAATDDDKSVLNDIGTADMDPKLKEAIDKMQKLDKILMKKVKKERQVKRDRLLLEKRLRDEISDMQHGSTNYREIKTNTERFLSLVPSSSHNQVSDVLLDYEEEEDMPPLFQTQVDESEMKGSKRKESLKQDMKDDGSIQSSSRASVDPDSTNISAAFESGEGKRNKGDRKDFIKRNIELSAAANEVIAMTDDEKKRLQDLLGDIDDIPELDDTILDDDENLQLTLNAGDGFLPDDIELKSLTNIDEKLKHIMPEDDYLSLSGSITPAHPPRNSTLFTRVGIRSTAMLDGFGEQVLYETKEERDLKAKLESIEKKLEMFKSPADETEQTGTSEYHLSDEKLDELLDQCARSMSRTSIANTPDSTARSEGSSRQALMENPPKLSDKQLQNLLSQAYFPMSSHLRALKEEESGDGDNGGVIAAETWKAIMEERLEEGDNDDDVDNFALNVSQNAMFDDNEHQNGPYKYDNLLGANMEKTDRNSINTLRNDYPSPSRLSSNSRKGSEDAMCFPKISSSSNSNLNRNSSSLSFEGSQTSSMDQIRLPNIGSSSFLIHASQGLNNEKVPLQKNNTINKEPISIVQNDLSDRFSLTSFSAENFDDLLPDNNGQKPH